MTEPWTGGRIQPIFSWINRAAATYARHNVILREDEKVNIVVEVIKDSGIVAANYSKWRKMDEANKTWPCVHTHLKKAAKDLKFQQSMRSGGFANAAQQTANLAAETIGQQAAAIDSSNTLVQNSNLLCANYAKRVGELEAQVRRGGSNNSGRTSRYSSGPFTKTHFCAVHTDGGKQAALIPFMWTLQPQKKRMQTLDPQARAQVRNNSDEPTRWRNSSTDCPFGPWPQDEMTGRDRRYV